MTGDHAPTISDVIDAAHAAGASIVTPVSPFLYVDMARVALPTPWVADRLAARLGAQPSGDALWKYDTDARLLVAVWRRHTASATMTSSDQRGTR